MYPPNYWESSDSEITFSGLQHYADAQNTAIKMLYESRKDLQNPRAAFIQPDIPEWNTVWQAIWSKGESTFQETVEVLRGTGSERFDDTLLSDAVPALCNVATIPAGLAGVWGLKRLIRPEYEEAQKAALWACRYKNPIPFDNIVFSGSPGIGKSVFLLLLLLRRLALGLPTGLQMDSRHSLLFWEGGVLKFGEDAMLTTYMTLKGTHNPLSRIWVLVDSKQNLTQPMEPFSDRGPFFVVAAAPPNGHFHWTKKTISYCFFMKPWTFSEVLQARSLVVPDDPPSEHDLWALYSDYGASPRHLFASARRPDFYIINVQWELDKVSPEKAQRLLDLDFGGETSDLLVLIEPSPDSRFVPKRRIVSDHIAELLLQKLQHDQRPVGPVPGHLSSLESLISGCVTF